MLGYVAPQQRDVISLRNWIDSNGCIAREETAYLNATENDLLCVAPQTDGPLIQVELFLQTIIIFFCDILGTVRI